MKLLFRIFLSLCFLLTGGYTYLNAYTTQDHVRNTPTNKTAFSEYTGPQLWFNSTLPHAERSNDKIEYNDSEDEDEDEDEDGHGVKKAAKTNSYLTSLFYSLANGDSAAEINTGFYFTKHFSELPSCRYILFRSIRV